MPRGKRKQSVTNFDRSSDESTSERIEPKSKKSKTHNNGLKFKSSSSNNNNNPRKHQIKYKKKNKNKDQGQLCDVKEILSYRINPHADSIILEALVEWADTDSSSNTWEGMDNLRYNLIFQDFIHENFKKCETQIYVTMANIKERMKNKIRKIYREYAKWYIMHEIVQPFDPFEYKAYQVFYHIVKDIPEKFTLFLEELVIKNYFFKLEEIQRTNCNKVAIMMSVKENINILIDNEEDFELPPEFEYITKNFFIDDIDNTIAEEPTEESKIKGCECVSCNANSQCCPQLVNEPFVYKELAKRPRIGLNRQEAIIECNENCKCTIDCINRATQQPRNITLCLFKTKDRGWGVKNADPKSVIKRGTFILEYTGELMGHHEASKRSVHSFLFDLNMERRTHGYYTIDAYKYGNITRFINHSCEPNSSIWFINDCLKNPKNQKLCIFADKDIEYDEEITIDYCPKNEIPTSDVRNYSQSFLCECYCQTSSCRGNIY